MKYAIIPSALLFICFVVSAQSRAAQHKRYPLIDLKDIAKHIGDTVQVHGEMLGYDTKTNNVLIYLGVDARQPKRLLAIVVKKSFDDKRYLNWAYSEVGAIGVVAKHKGKLELILTDPLGLTVGVED